MKGYEFIDNKGTFKLEDPDLYSYLYFPVGAASGMMGSLTPEFGGDLKTSQNTFILEPVSSDNLHNNRSTRNFWICLEDGTLVSATGASASRTSWPDTRSVIPGNSTLRISPICAASPPRGWATSPARESTI